MNESLESDELGRGRFLRLVANDGWEYCERVNATGVVVVVPVTDDGELVLTEQFRPAVGATVIDLPAGLAGDGADIKSEPLSAAARRELVEEVGYDADEIVELAAGPTSAGLTSEVVTFFAARKLKQVSNGGGDANENITVHRVALDELKPWLDGRESRGCLIDPKIFAGLWLFNTSGPSNESE